MEPPVHHLSDLFDQLGLPSDPPAIQAFIQRHRSPGRAIALADAPFWTPAQAQFLRQGLQEDADWSEKIDQLAVMLGT
jgi:hypothetical protein